MAAPMSFVVAGQRVVKIFFRQRFFLDKKIKDFLEERDVVPALLNELEVLFKLR
jgi:hypothetical protein